MLKLPTVTHNSSLTRTRTNRTLLEKVVSDGRSCVPGEHRGIGPAVLQHTQGESVAKLTEKRYQSIAGSATHMVTREAKCGRKPGLKQVTPRLSHEGSARAPSTRGSTGARRSRHVADLRTVARCVPYIVS